MYKDFSSALIGGNHDDVCLLTLSKCLTLMLIAAVRRQRYRIKTLWSDNILLAGEGKKQSGWLQCRSVVIPVAHSGTRQAFRARMPLTRWHFYLCAKHVNDALNTHPPSVRVEEGGHHFDRSWQVMAQRHANTWSDLSTRESRLTRKWERGPSGEPVLQGNSFCNYRQTWNGDRELEEFRPHVGLLSRLTIYPSFSFHFSHCAQKTIGKFLAAGGKHRLTDWSENRNLPKSSRKHVRTKSWQVNVYVR